MANGIRMNIYKYVFMYMYTYMYTYIYTHTHRHICMYIGAVDGDRTGKMGYTYICINMYIYI